VQGQLIQNYGPTPIMDRMSLHGPKIAKVVMWPGFDLLAKAGSMIAYEGLVEFDPMVPRVRQMAAQWATGEGVHLMNCRGQGLLYLADYNKDVIVMQLQNESVTVNGKNILGFDASLEWGIERVKGVTLGSGMGMFNIAIRGTGWVAFGAHGIPISFDASQTEILVDTDALVAYTSGLHTRLHRSAGLGSLIGRGSGEAFQLGFSGQGWVIVQPSEDPRHHLAVRG
jgi:uncharacterized protein (AIM24 family)